MDVPAWLSLDGTTFESRGDEFYWLWILATTTYGVGDVVTTVALIYFDAAVSEANVLVRGAVETFGLTGLVGLKIGVLVLCITVQAYAMGEDDPYVAYGPPALLAVVGAFTTAFNIRLLLG
ncbi:hypothetical protein [Halorussus halophilus]|uniref:hypothetical protein n=1 Tax=Halorussus halophilus TaxID=2650975 RepID=UPI001300ED02|nr:hypothetical protein [Halorussus halophilus]